MYPPLSNLSEFNYYIVVLMNPKLSFVKLIDKHHMVFWAVNEISISREAGKHITVIFHILAEISVC
jgi:hypothetical protein